MLINILLSSVCLNSNASDKNFHNKLQAIKMRKREREKKKKFHWYSKLKTRKTRCSLDDKIVLSFSLFLANFALICFEEEKKEKSFIRFDVLLSILEDLLYKSMYFGPLFSN